MPPLKFDPSNPPPDPSNTIRILFTTDNHLGHNEAHPHLSKDAQTTFREILSIATSQIPSIDFILQGGDLFDVSKPSKQTLWQTIRSLRDYIHGETTNNEVCELELLSDPSESLTNGMVNFEDPNMNISLPIFAISGNHDESSGMGLLSPLDLLSAMGLINRIGHVQAEDDITVRPVLLQKGTTKIGLYGLGNVRDERLKRSFEEGKVKFLRPENYSEYFNLLAVHQNHTAHGEHVAHVPESYLPSFMDLVLWGHEHECIPEPVHNQQMGFDVLQGGSSVATSLCVSETKTKFVFILTVIGAGEYYIEKIPLKTVRPFVMKDIKLAEIKELQGTISRSDVNAYLCDLVDSLIEQAETQYVEANAEMFEDIDDSDEKKSLIPLPLVRLRVDYTGGYEVENPRRFSNRFVGKVANVDNVVQFHTKKQISVNINKTRKLTKLDPEDEEDSGTTAQQDISIQTYVQQYLQQSQTPLTLLPELGLSTAVKRMIENEDKTQIGEYVKYEMSLQVESFLDLTKNLDGGDDGAFEVEFKEVLKGVKEQRLRDVMRGSYMANTTTSASTTVNNSRKAKKSTISNDSDEEMELFTADPPSTARSIPRRGGRGSRTIATRTSKSTKNTSIKSKEIIESDEEELPDLEDEEEEEVEEFHVVASEEEEEDDDLEQIKKPTRTRSRGNNTTTVKKTPRIQTTRKRAAAVEPVVQSYDIISDDEIQESDDEVQEIKPIKKSSRGGRGRGGRGSSNSDIISSQRGSSTQSQLMKGSATSNIAALLSRKRKSK